MGRLRISNPDSIKIYTMGTSCRCHANWRIKELWDVRYTTTCHDTGLRIVLQNEFAGEDFSPKENPTSQKTKNTE